MSTHNKPFINIAHYMANTRIYYINNEFYVNTVTSEEILPFISKRANHVADFLVRILKHEPMANLHFGFPTNYPEYKKTKIYSLCGDHDNINHRLMMKFLLLLV